MRSVHSMRLVSTSHVTGSASRIDRVPGADPMKVPACLSGEAWPAGASISAPSATVAATNALMTNSLAGMDKRWPRSFFPPVDGDEEIRAAQLDHSGLCGIEQQRL